MRKKLKNKPIAYPSITLLISTNAKIPYIMASKGVSSPTDASDKQKKSKFVIEENPGKLAIQMIKSPSFKLPIPEKFAKNNRFLIPDSFRIADVLTVVHKSLEIDNATALLLFVGGNSYIPATSMKELYDKYKNEDDGILYITYATECTFG